MFSKCIHKHIYHILTLDSIAQNTSTLIKTVTSINRHIPKSCNCAGVKKTYNKIHKYKHDKLTSLIKSVWIYAQKNIFIYG